MSEAYDPKATPAQALVSLYQIVFMKETEPVIDMYERAAWASGATREETQRTIRQARLAA